MWRLTFVLFAGATLLQAQSRFTTEPGWRPLLNGNDTVGWHAQEGGADEWFATPSVHWDAATGEHFTAVPAPGGIILNGLKGRTANLVSDEKFGDVELYVEFMVARKSNSGVYLHGLYEVQILDSYGKDQPNVHDCGAIYERWINGQGVGGSPPRRNASRPPGEWQSFEIQFRAPRFDRNSRKVANAKFLRVLHNGVLIQENFETDGPTRAAMDLPEAASNPLMLQGTHGPVAFRNIYIRPSSAAK